MLIKGNQKMYAKIPAKGLTKQQKAVCDFCKKDLWKCFKFINDEEGLVNSVKWVLKRYQPLKMEGLEGEDYEAQELIWIHNNADLGQIAINQQCHYANEELAKVYLEKVWPDKKGDEFPTPEDIEDIVFHWNMEDDHPDQEANLTKLVNMIDFMVAKVATNSAWGPGACHVLPMMTAMQPKDGDLEQLPAVS